MITPEIGKTYLIKISTGRCLARCTDIRHGGGFDTVSRVFGVARHVRAYTRYDFINLRTNRTVTLESRRKILAEA